MHTKLQIKVVNKNLGDIPNSIWNSDVKQSGFDNLDFLVHLNYKGEYSFHDINDVKNNPNDTFYFPYYCSLMHFSDLYDKKENKNLLKLVDLLKQKNVKILFFEPHEVYSDFQLQKLSDFIDFFKIEKNRFFYITNDIQIEDKSKNLNFIGKKYNHLWINTSNGYIEDTRDINFKTEREFVFLNKNKKAKPHRLIILAILQKYNLLHISNYSFLRGIQKEFDLDELVFGGSNKLDIDLEVMYSKHGGMPQEFVESPYLNHLQKNILNISNWPLVKTKYEKSSDMVSHLKNGSNFAGMLQVKDYEESYINITSETQYIENYVHISEKSLKPFAVYQLPIIVASVNHIKCMKEYYDLDFFDDFIDHSYDNEKDNSKRLIMIQDEILRLSKLQKELPKFFEENKQRFISNRKKIEEISNWKETKLLNYILNF